MQLRTERVARLEGDAAGRLRLVRFEGDAPPLACDALFFATCCPQRSPLPELLGCSLDDTNAVRCDDHAAAGVPGLYVAGNVRGGAHLAITAAAEGAEAAMAMNEVLLQLGQRRRS